MMLGGGHTADTVVGGHERIVRQTVIVMLKGAVLAEHESPGAATVHVRGRVRLSAGTCPGRGGPVTACRAGRAPQPRGAGGLGGAADGRQAAVTAFAVPGRPFRCQRSRTRSAPASLT